MGFMNETRGLISPNLDALAHDGIILKNYYVQPICSPTRSALMSGRYTIRLGTQSSVIYWDNPWGVPINETFLVQNLKDVGYHSALFGKWVSSAPSYPCDGGNSGSRSYMSSPLLPHVTHTAPKMLDRSAFGLFHGKVHPDGPRLR